MRTGTGKGLKTKDLLLLRELRDKFGTSQFMVRDLEVEPKEARRIGSMLRRIYSAGAVDRTRVYDTNSGGRLHKYLINDRGMELAEAI